MKKHSIKIIGALVIAGIWLALWYSGIFRSWSLSSLLAYRDTTVQYVRVNYGPSLALYTLLYSIGITLAIPGGFVFTMLGGFLFGPLPATIAVVVASTTGAYLCALWVRYMVGSIIQNRYKEKLSQFNAHLKTYGVAYLITARLFPFTPFVLVNILVGLTHIPLSTFACATGCGMIPAAYAYALLGKEVYGVHALPEMITPTSLVVSSILLIMSVIPLLWQYYTKAKTRSHTF